MKEVKDRLLSAVFKRGVKHYTACLLVRHAVCAVVLASTLVELYFAITNKQTPRWA